MSAREKLVHAAVDRLLQSQGAYAPVELLLQQSRLAYPRYEAWRVGEADDLESQLAGNPGRVREMLEQAATWARRLGLSPQPQQYTGWGANAGRTLRFCAPADGRWEGLYATHYARVEPAPQMDLFLDAGPGAVLHDLAEALRSRQAGLARRHLRELLRNSPEHSQRGAAELLCDALDNLDSGASVNDAAVELQAIETHLAPAAMALLGAGARDLLAPFWRRLGHALAGQAFDPAQPHLHASWALAQCLDWPGVIEAIAADPGADSEAELLRRRAEAEQRRGERITALGHYCRLCWLHPQVAAQALADPSVDSGLRRAWAGFEALEQAELEDIEWFPSWLLLFEPGLAQHLQPGSPDQPGAAVSAFYNLKGLQTSHEEGATQIEYRRRLRDDNPALLAEFLRRRVGA